MPTVLPLVLAAVTALPAPFLPARTGPSPGTVPTSATAVSPAGPTTPAVPTATDASDGVAPEGTVRGPVRPKVRTIRLRGTGDGPGRRAAAQTTEPTADAQAADPSDGAALPQGLRTALSGPATPTDPFGVVGVSWTGALPEDTVIQVKVREGEQWSGWRTLPAEDSAPDPGTSEARAVGPAGATEPLLVAGPVHGEGDGASGGSGVQVRVLNRDGSPPRDVAVNLVDAGTAVARPQKAAGATDAGATDPGTASASPVIRSRSRWGADESLRSGTVTLVTDPRMGIVHHTAGSNAYGRSQVPGIIRGIYAYHTKVRKWNDIGYNYLVDRFGGVWEGRYGGLGKVVQGAHAKGFNSHSFGVSVLGNFESARPPQAVLTGLTRVLAWKMSQQQIDPSVRTTVTSLGNPGYPAGTRVTRWTVSGHRDVYPTACPGRYLSSALPGIRASVARSMTGQLFDPRVTPGAVLPGRAAEVAVSAKVIGGGRWGVVVRRDCDGRLVRSVAGWGTRLSWRWPLKDASGAASASGVYRVTLSGSGSSARAVSTTWTEVLPTEGTPVGGCPVTRLTPGAVSLISQGVRARTGGSRSLVVVASESVRRPEQVSAGVLARSLDAGLVSTPSSVLASWVAARIRSDRVERVLLVGADGTWGAPLLSSLRSSGVEVEFLGGADRHEVLAAVATRIFRGRALPTSAVLVDSADPVPAVAGAMIGAVRGLPVLSVGASRMPPATARFLEGLGARGVIMAGTGAMPVSEGRTPLGAGVSVSDLREGTAARAVVSVLDSLPVWLRRPLVGVARTSSGGLDVVLASALGQPLLPVGGGQGTEGLAWLRSHGTQVGRLTVAAGPSQVTPTELRALAPLVRGVSSVASPPSPAPSPTPSSSRTTSNTVSPSLPASFEVTGSGYGHGVGMSQYGAYAQALRGRNLQEITAHYYRGSALSTVDDAVPLRVNLLHQARQVTLRVSSVPGFSGWPALRLRTPAGGVPVSTTDSVSIVPSGGTGVKIFKNGRNVLTLGTSTGLQIVWTGTWFFSGTPALALLSGTGTGGTKSGSRYRYGILQVVRVGNRLEAVNVISLGQHYLRGLAEMPASWGVDGGTALQAQAVAGRTYALRKYRAGVRSGCGCHLYDSTRDQVFAGWSKETGTYGKYWTSAVSSTARMVLTYGGSLAEAVYFSSSAGRTENAQDVWGSAVPYLTSVSDPYSLDSAVKNPMASWKRTVSQKALAGVFGLPDVVASAVSSRTAGGAAAKVSAVSSGGRWASVTGARLYSGLGLPAAWVSTLRPGS